MKGRLVSENFMHLFTKGDERCLIKIGDNVIKVAQDSDKDIHPIGTRGVVVGNQHVDGVDCYLVNFGDGGVLSFVIGWKIKKAE